MITYLCEAIHFGGRISISLNMHINQFNSLNAGICLIPLLFWGMIWTCISFWWNIRFFWFEKEEMKEIIFEYETGPNYMIPFRMAYYRAITIDTNFMERTKKIKSYSLWWKLGNEVWQFGYCTLCTVQCTLLQSSIEHSIHSTINNGNFYNRETTNLIKICSQRDSLFRNRWSPILPQNDRF